jgi:hypothetical protein
MALTRQLLLIDAVNSKRKRVIPDALGTRIRARLEAISAHAELRHTSLGP